jgi:hypothetical protein
MIGLAWFVWTAGLRTLDPTNLGWVLQGDWAQHVTGWLLYRNEPWRFPLGALHSAPYPVGTTIGFSDSNPIVSTILKVFSPWLPTDFHFIGLWLAACFAAQGVVGARITALFTTSRAQQALGGGLIAMSPVLVYRMPHDTLCAHWLLLTLLYLGLRPYPNPQARRRALAGATALVWLAAGIHPYLTLMCLALAVALCVCAWRARHLTAAGAVLWAAAAAAGAIAVFWIFGYFSNPSLGTSGFGEYSSDLLSFLDSEGHSRTLPALGLIHTKYGEGFGFLGLGGLLALAAAVAAFVRRRPAHCGRLWPIAAACVATMLYAGAPVVRAGGHPVLTMHTVFAHLAGLTAVFRASGRFIWPMHYLLLAFGVWGLVRLAGARRGLATVLLGAAVALQAVDTDPSSGRFTPAPETQLPVGDWAPAAGRYAHIALVPMWVPGGCGDGWMDREVVRYILQAYRLKMTINSGSFSRPSAERLAPVCAAFEAAVAAGALEPDTIYVFLGPRPPSFAAVGAVCGLRSEGHYVCVDRGSDAGFRAYLETHH